MRINAIEEVRGRSQSTDTSDKIVIQAPGPGIRLFITSLMISNSSSTATEVNIKDPGDSTKDVTYPAPASGGAIHALPSPMVLTPNQPLVFNSVSGVTTMKVSAIGYKGQ